MCRHLRAALWTLNCRLDMQYINSVARFNTQLLAYKSKHSCIAVKSHFYHYIFHHLCIKLNHTLTCARVIENSVFALFDFLVSDAGVWVELKIVQAIN